MWDTPDQQSAPRAQESGQAATDEVAEAADRVGPITLSATARHWLGHVAASAPLPPDPLYNRARACWAARQLLADDTPLDHDDVAAVYAAAVMLPALRGLPPTLPPGVPTAEFELTYKTVPGWRHRFDPSRSLNMAFGSMIEFGTSWAQIAAGVLEPWVHYKTTLSWQPEHIHRTPDPTWVRRRFLRTHGAGAVVTYPQVGSFARDYPVSWQGGTDHIPPSVRQWAATSRRLRVGLRKDVLIIARLIWADVYLTMLAGLSLVDLSEPDAKPGPVFTLGWMYAAVTLSLGKLEGEVNEVALFTGSHLSSPNCGVPVR